MRSSVLFCSTTNLLDYTLVPLSHESRSVRRICRKATQREKLDPCAFGEHPFGTRVQIASLRLLRARADAGEATGAIGLARSTRGATRSGRSKTGTQRANRTGCGDLARRMAEHELVIRHIAEHRVTGIPLPRQQLLGERILNQPLDGAAQRTGPVGQIGTLAHDLVERLVGEHDVHAVGNQTFAQVGNEQLGDACAPPSPGS